MTTTTTHRTEAEIATELHALNALLTNPVILAHDAERDDLAPIETIRAQIRVVRERMTYPALLDAYEDNEDIGSEYILGGAYDAFQWLYEDGISPSSGWQENIDESYTLVYTVSPVAAV